MRKKILSCILIIMMAIPFIYNCCYAEINNSIREHLFYIEVGDQFSTHDFWEINIGSIDPYDTKSNEVLKAVKNAGESKCGPQALIILAKYVIWLNGQSYQNLAKTNDDNYLQIGQLALTAGEKLLRTRSQDSTADGSLTMENRSPFDQSMDIYKNAGKKVTADNLVTDEELGEVLRNFIYDIERNKKRFNAAIDYNQTNTKLQDNYDKKVKYSRQEIVLYLNKYGVRLNISDPDKETVKQVWAYGLSGNISDIQKVSFGTTQIKAFVKMKGNNTNYGNDSVIQEWYSMITNGKHTDWYNNNIQNGELRTGKWNKSLEEKDRKKMIQEIKNYGENAQWTQQEKDTAEKKLADITDMDIEKAYRLATGQKINTVVEGNEEIGLENYGQEEDDPGIEYYHPKVSKTTETMDIDKTIEDSENFIKTDDKNSNNNIDSQQLSDFFNPIYNVALIIGIIVSVIVGAILGIKFMTGSVEQKADTKKLLIPYVAGCIAVFGAFFIWKLVVTIMAGL